MEDCFFDDEDFEFGKGVDDKFIPLIVHYTLIKYQPNE
jgi:hypothetical protein